MNNQDKVRVIFIVAKPGLVMKSFNCQFSVKISFKNYRSVHPKIQEDEVEDEEEIWEDDYKDG